MPKKVNLEYLENAVHVPFLMGFSNNQAVRGFEDTTTGFRISLESMGIENFTSGELIQTYGIEAMGKQIEWPYANIPRILAVGCVLQRMREHIGSPIKVKWLYRPKEINDAVGGAKDSDHLYALAADCYFEDYPEREQAKRWFDNLRDAHPQLKGRMGIGQSPMLHIGILIDRGYCTWQYEKGGGITKVD